MMIGGLAWAAIGCQDAPPVNRGLIKSRDISSRDATEGTQLGSLDLTTATQRAVGKLVERLGEIEKKKKGKIVIVLDRVENKTSDPSANFEIYLARIRAVMNQTGSRHDVQFVAKNARAAAIRKREGLAKPGNRNRPDYALTAAFYDMPRGATNYYLLTFQLVDVETGDIIWEPPQYEVKL
jgi:PBP1b-binding outer membrane lipoprotein LpoB